MCIRDRLEPVATGDAVAGPVVEVLVRDDALDGREIGIGGRGRRGQHVLGVEEVEPLVLHRAAVVVLHGHDHEAVQVQRQSVPSLVPDHAGHQRSHRVLGLVQVARANVDLQQVVAPAACADGLLAHRQVAGHQREQVAGLGVGVHPAGEVAAVVQRALLDQVAVAQQHRETGLVGAQQHAVRGHHVGPIQEVCDAPKALGLALGEEAAAAGVQLSLIHI